MLWGMSILRATLTFLPNVPGATFIQGGTFIPDSRVGSLKFQNSE